MNFKISIVYIVIVITLIQLSCSDASKEMIPGRYSMNGNSIDSIYIYNNGTYKQKYIASDSNILYNSGNWRFNVTRIVFDDFIFFNDQGPKNRRGGYWDAEVRLANKKEVRLIYSFEDDIYYYKDEK